MAAASPASTRLGPSRQTMKRKHATRSASPAARGTRKLGIRRVEIRDYESIVALHKDSGATVNSNYWQAQFVQYVGSGGQRIALVAEKDGAIKGVIMGEVRAWEFGSPVCGWIFVLTVHPSHRNQAIGCRLFEEICEHFRQLGVSKVRSMVPRSSKLIHSFFRAQGMRAGPFIQLEKSLGPAKSGKSRAAVGHDPKNQ